MEDGAAIIVHTVQHLVRCYGDSEKAAMVSIDLDNAFNIVNRWWMLRAVRTYFPAMYKFVLATYSSQLNPVLLFGNEQILSIAGTQQGDSLSPLLFALVLHDLLKMPFLPPTFRDDPFLIKYLFYLNDGYLVGPHHQVRHVLHFLNSQPPSSCSRSQTLCEEMHKMVADCTNAGSIR